MSYYSEEFFQGVIVGIVICLSILRAVLRRNNQQQRAAKTRRRPQEHDERFL